MVGREHTCIHEARRMFSEHRGGQIWRVSGQNEAGTQYVQNYFVPPQANEGDLALNCRDNGYFNAPAFTVKDVRERGQQVNPFEIK